MLMVAFVCYVVAVLTDGVLNMENLLLLWLAGSAFAIVWAAWVTGP